MQDLLLSTKAPDQVRGPQSAQNSHRQVVTGLPAGLQVVVKQEGGVQFQHVKKELQFYCVKEECVKDDV